MNKKSNINLIIQKHWP